MEETVPEGRQVQSSHLRSSHAGGRGSRRSLETKPSNPKKQQYLRSQVEHRPHRGGIQKNRNLTKHHNRRDFMKPRACRLLTSPQRPQNLQASRKGHVIQQKKNYGQSSNRPENSADKMVLPDSTKVQHHPTKHAPSDFPIPLDAQKENTGNDTSPTTGYEGGSGGRKKKSRRKRKAGDHHPVGRTTKWKPYDMLTWEERQALDEKASKRATTRREEQMANGQPMAPYNTTQFLMEQHALTGTPPELRAHISGKLAQKLALPRDRKPSGSLTAEDDDSPTTDDNYSSVGGADGDGNDDYETIFLQKDFADAYNNFRAERLETLTREELMKEYLDIEGKLESVYTRLNEMCYPEGEVSSKEADQLDPVIVVQEEMERLRSENKKLVQEVEQLRKLASSST